MKHIFIIGSKGIPASYGGFETFVEKLTYFKKSKEILYHVARLSDHDGIDYYNGAECFNVPVPQVGAATAVLYDIAALHQAIQYCEKNNISNSPVFYILACRIGPFISFFKKKISNIGGLLYINPDGHEWKRGKWSYPIKCYWKYSEKLMVRVADHIICDSKNIEKYIQRDYGRFQPLTSYIAYGSEIKYLENRKTEENDIYAQFSQWLNTHGLKMKEYYLIVGRFVPENNFETIIREFMKSNADKNLVVITTANEKLFNKLEKNLQFHKDSRVKFVGTVYDQELLKIIRYNALAYFHGHEVGGTNPSLLEAMGTTGLVLLYDVNFNREVAEDAALYWTKEKGNLSSLIEKVEHMDSDELKQLGLEARGRVEEYYSWDDIVEKYEKLFLMEAGS